MKPAAGLQRVNMQLEVLGWVEKRNYLESGVQMNGILNDLLLWVAEEAALFWDLESDATLFAAWDAIVVNGHIIILKDRHCWVMQDLFIYLFFSPWCYFELVEQWFLRLSNSSCCSKNQCMFFLLEVSVFPSDLPSRAACSRSSREVVWK